MNSPIPWDGGSSPPSLLSCYARHETISCSLMAVSGGSSDDGGFHTKIFPCHSFAPKSRSAYQKRATPPPARNRRLPAHNLLDSDSSDAEARPQWSYSPRSPPRKAPYRAEDDLLGYRHHNAPVFPEPPHGYYESKQAYAYSSEPQPSTSRDQTYAWPPPPRDFDNDRVESLASTEDEPDYSFAAVIDMIRTLHDIEKPTTAAPSRTATAFDQMRGLQNDRAPVFHLPMSHLLGGLIDDVNTTS